MAGSSAKEQTPELEKVRRHVRILVDLGRAAGETADLNRFLDQAVVQVARAVEIDHVKVLRYRRREADLLVAARFRMAGGCRALRNFARRFAVAPRALVPNGRTGLDQELG